MKHIVLLFFVIFFVGCSQPVDIVTAEEQLLLDIEAIDKYLADNKITAVSHSSG